MPPKYTIRLSSDESRSILKSWHPTMALISKRMVDSDDHYRAQYRVACEDTSQEGCPIYIAEYRRDFREYGVNHVPWHEVETVSWGLGESSTETETVYRYKSPVDKLEDAGAIPEPPPRPAARAYNPLRDYMIDANIHGGPVAAPPPMAWVQAYGEGNAPNPLYNAGNLPGIGRPNLQAELNAALDRLNMRNPAPAEEAVDRAVEDGD